MGNGHDTLFLAQLAKQVYAFDIQEQALEKTRQRLAEAGLDNVQLISVSYTHLKCDPKFNIPLGVSNHHVHLSQADADILFGKGYNFSELKPLSQKGQFAYKEGLILEVYKRQPVNRMG